jgi:hypothetical protein
LAGRTRGFRTASRRNLSCGRWRKRNLPDKRLKLLLRDKRLKPLKVLRQSITRSVDRHIKQCAEAAGLNKPNSHFRDDVIDAILLCIAALLDAPNRKRYSDIKRDMSRASEEAAAALEKLNHLQRALDNVTGQLMIEQLPTPARIALRLMFEQAPWLHHISLLARAWAARITDKGGRTRMFAFEILVSALYKAYERASGERPPLSYRDDKSDEKPDYDSPLIKLVEAALPLVRQFVRDEPPLMVPDTPVRRAKYIYDNYRPGAAKMKRSRPKP